MSACMRLLAATALVLCAGAASGSETVTFSYDQRGRLVQVDRSGSVNNGIAGGYSYDHGDNRTNVAVTGGGTVAHPRFSVGNTSSSEGAPLVFVVAKTGSAGSSYSVSYSTGNGSAAAGSDFATASGTLTFAASETSKTVSVATTDDTVVEGAETVHLSLSNPTGGSTVSIAQGLGTINDNDAKPNFSINSATAAEGGAGLSFTVTKTGSATASYSVSYSTSNGTAVAGSDYPATSGTLTFAPSEYWKTVLILPINDTAAEPQESFHLNLSSPTGGSTISVAQGIGTINDNDTATPSFSVNDVSATEGSDLVFTVTKSGSVGSTFSVSFATSNGTAAAGSDFTPASGTLSFTPSETHKSIRISTTDDSAMENSETVLLNLSNPSGGGLIGDGQGVGTISDNDNIPPPGCYYWNGQLICN